MTQLFAAEDSRGTIRFAAEVPRGSACGCFCPVCASPLVAKQGTQLQWHFAHEGGQERPECLVGAVNLMHRIGAQVLQEGGSFELPPYRERVQYRHLQTEVSWKAQFVRGSLQWTSRPTRNAPVATAMLDSGARVAVYVMVSQERPSFMPTVGAADAQVIIWFPMPSGADLLKMVYVRQHIMRNAQVEWRHHPDVFGHVAASLERMREQVRAEDSQRTAAAGARWAAIARQMQRRGLDADADLAPTPSAMVQVEQARAPATGKGDVSYSWAPQRKPMSSFVHYRLRDGSAWVVYTRKDNTMGVVPYPAFEGWDESLPASVATPSTHEGLYLAPSLVPVLMFMSARAETTRTSSDPKDFEGL